MSVSSWAHARLSCSAVVSAIAHIGGNQFVAFSINGGGVFCLSLLEHQGSAMVVLNQWNVNNPKGA